MNKILCYFILLTSVYHCCLCAKKPGKGCVNRDNSCWWSGCQPNEGWAQTGCPGGYTEINRQPCDGKSTKYYCCPGTTNPNPQPVPGTGGQSGRCSWYGAEGEIPPGHPTASGEGFNRFAMRAAHLTLPFGTRIRVTNKSNGQTVDVTINDRGPYCPAGVTCPPHIIPIVDLTYGAMVRIANTDTGVIPCSYVII